MRRRPAPTRAAAVALVCLAGFVSVASGATLVINELLPDPAGSDDGREFVELLNTSPLPVPLADVELQFANGAAGATWTTRWRGGPDDVLQAGCRFLIVDRNWTGAAANAEVWLGLQNGPDAVRLARAGAMIDIVGYGALTDTLLFAGAPAPLTPGLSLSRRPDGISTGVNADDFVSAEPTPGRANFLAHQVVVDHVDREPPSLADAGDAFRLTLELRNAGTETLPSTPILLTGDVVAPPAFLDQMAPDARRTVIWYPRASRRGRLPVGALVPIGDTGDTLYVPLGAVQAGPGALVLNEVLAAPSQGQGEWIELAVTGDAPVALETYALRDADGDWRGLPAELLWPGDLLVVAQDSAALADWTADVADHGAPASCAAERPGRIRTLAGWPSLNNGPPASRDYADRVSLRTGDVVVDHLTLGGGGAPEPRAASLERVAPYPLRPGAGLWMESTHPAGSTPGCPNSVDAGSVFATAGPGLRLSSVAVDRRSGPTTIHLRFGLTFPASAWDLQIFDLWGRRVRDLGGDAVGPGPREAIWSALDDAGRPVDAGGYVAVLRLFGPAGGILERHKALLVVR